MTDNHTETNTHPITVELRAGDRATGEITWTPKPGLIESLSALEYIELVKDLRQELGDALNHALDQVEAEVLGEITLEDSDGFFVAVNDDCEPGGKGCDEDEDCDCHCEACEEERAATEALFPDEDDEDSEDDTDPADEGPGDEPSKTEQMIAEAILLPVHRAQVGLPVRGTVEYQIEVKNRLGHIVTATAELAYDLTDQEPAPKLSTAEVDAAVAEAVARAMRFAGYDVDTSGIITYSATLSGAGELGGSGSFDLVDAPRP